MGITPYLQLLVVLGIFYMVDAVINNFMKIFLIVFIIFVVICFANLWVEEQNTTTPVGSVLVYDQSSALFRNEDGTYSTRVPITICNVRWGIEMCDRFIEEIKFSYEYRKLR